MCEDRPPHRLRPPCRLRPSLTSFANRRAGRSFPTAARALLFNRRTERCSPNTVRVATRQSPTSTPSAALGGSAASTPSAHVDFVCRTRGLRRANSPCISSTSLHRLRFINFASSISLHQLRSPRRLLSRLGGSTTTSPLTTTATRRLSSDQDAAPAALGGSVISS